MGFNLLKTRSGKLENTINIELTKSNPNVEKILDAVYEYEKANLITIEKLKRDKKIITNRISGAIKQTIQSHGPITMVLIGSATKRIYGAILSDEPNKKSFINKIISIINKWIN